MKKLVIIILLLIPFLVKADCDYDKHKEYLSYASRINYENTYNKTTNSFSITIYNIIDGMSVKYNNKEYKANDEDIVIIDGISEGTNVNISIFANDGCSEIRIINVNEQYYNSYYGSDLCSGYEDKLVYCSHQFTSIKTNESLVENAKKNYDKTIVSEKEEEKKEEEENNLLDKLIKFGLNYGIKILLVIITVVISSAFYNSKLRRIKHGI